MIRYRPGVAQRVGRVIALLFHDRCTRREWVVSSTPRPHFTPGKGPVPIVQQAGWAPGPVWTGGKSRPHRDSIPDRPVRSQSLYRLRYPAHCILLWTRPNQSTYTLADSICAGCFCLTPAFFQFTAFMCSCTDDIFIHPIPQSTVRISNIKKVSLAKPFQPNVVSEVTS